MKSRADSYGWWVKKYNEGGIKSSFDGFRYGTCNQPTGTGKASEQISDLATRIPIAKALKKKLIVDLASPRIALSYQLAGNMIYCLKTVGLISPENTAIVVNNSGPKDPYTEDPEMSDFLRISPEEMATTDKEIYIVVSCYPSHYRIENVLKTSFQDAIKVDYWDEAHTILNKGLLDDEENTVSLNIPLSLELFTNIYAFSATPKPEITEILAKKEAAWNSNFVYDYSGYKGERYLKQITIKEAIERLMILPVSFQTASTPSLSTLDNKLHLCLNVLQKVKARTAKMNHKVLVTLTSADDVVAALKYFKEEGIMAFGTTSKYGFCSNDEFTNARLQKASITDFTNEISQYDGDCFVVHIQQLIEGIDVDCLTAAVLFCVPNDTNIATLIQIIGRILRFYHNPELGKSERGMPFEERKKKFGYVYWAIENASLASDGEKIADFFLRVYDCGECECHIGSNNELTNTNGGGSMLLGGSQNGYHDTHCSETGFRLDVSPIVINTIDALVKFLPYVHLNVPGSMPWKMVADAIRERIQNCVDETYTQEDWLVNKRQEIEVAKRVMVEREPRLEELFKSYNIDFS